jgi:hypothetical protein
MVPKNFKYISVFVLPGREEDPKRDRIFIFTVQKTLNFASPCIVYQGEKNSNRGSFWTRMTSGPKSAFIENDSSAHNFGARARLLIQVVPPTF